MFFNIWLFKFFNVNMTVSLSFSITANKTGKKMRLLDEVAPQYYMTFELDKPSYSNKSLYQIFSPYHNDLESQVNHLFSYIDKVVYIHLMVLIHVYKT